VIDAPDARAGGTPRRRPGRRFAVVRTSDRDVVRADDDAGGGEGYRLAMQRIRELWRDDRGRLAHYLVASSLAVLLLVEMFTVDAEPRWYFAALGVAGAIALLLSRRFTFWAPLAAALAIAATLVYEPEQIQDLESPFFVVILFAPWCLATYNSRPRAVAGLVVMEAIGIWANIRFGSLLSDYIWIAGFIALSWATGFILSRRTAHARELAERAERLEQARAAEAERAVDEERARIARELHDVVGHSVSVMTVQASAVRRLLRDDQVKEREALLVVEETGRQALAEMRVMVGVLRRPEESPTLAPQPSLDSLDGLVAQMREAGLPVTLRFEGEPRALPPGLDLTAYRLVQEGLTNALKHAKASSAEVVVTYGDDELELEVTDDGRGGATRSDDGGHGLVGMRERVAVYGGELDSGPRADGGYRLHVRLPVAVI
jgi:signal transduction histidine kinase